ncbi:MAG: hypothetical protein IJH75_01580 [Mogibacterium sp.]|nr:hypothetical protein [Mogibacterium sp.]
MRAEKIGMVALLTAVLILPAAVWGTERSEEDSPPPEILQEQQAEEPQSEEDTAVREPEEDAAAEDVPPAEEPAEDDTGDASEAEEVSSGEDVNSTGDPENGAEEALETDPDGGGEAGALYSPSMDSTGARFDGAAGRSGGTAAGEERINGAKNSD